MSFSLTDFCSFLAPITHSCSCSCQLFICVCINSKLYSTSAQHVCYKTDKKRFYPRKRISLHIKWKHPQSIENRPPISKLFWNMWNEHTHANSQPNNNVLHTEEEKPANELLWLLLFHLSMNFGERQHNYVLGQNIHPRFPPSLFEENFLGVRCQTLFMLRMVNLDDEHVEFKCSYSRHLIHIRLLDKVLMVIIIASQYEVIITFCIWA